MALKVDYDKPVKSYKNQDIYKKIFHESELNQNEYEENITFKFSSRLLLSGCRFWKWRIDWRY